MTRLSLHPLCAAAPRLSDEEYKALREDIRRNGQRVPIVMYRGQILDGANRYSACLELGIEPEIVEFEGDDPGAFVISINRRRRHLTPGQNAAFVAAVTDWQKAQKHGGDRKSDQVATLPLDSIADRATASGASKRTQRMADKVAKTAPDLAKKVADGELSLPQAAASVARMSASNHNHSDPAATAKKAKDGEPATRKAHGSGKPRTGPKADALRAGLTEASLHAGSLLCTYARLTLGSVRTQETFVEEERGLIQELDSAIHQRGLGASQS